jgi:hypothetical protein
MRCGAPTKNRKAVMDGVKIVTKEERGDKRALERRGCMLTESEPDESREGNNKFRQVDAKRRAKGVISESNRQSSSAAREAESQQALGKAR